MTDEQMAQKWWNAQTQPPDWSANGFIGAYLAGLRAQRELDALIAWRAVRTAAERMDDADGCALMADIAESAIRRGK